MTCVGSGNLVVCYDDGQYERRILPCWGLCGGVRRRVLVRHGSPYYDPSAHCVACGDAWSGGWLRERPFRRGWRAQAIAENRAIWARTPPGRVRFDADYYPLPRTA